MNLKHELQSIISGIGDHSAEDIIKAAAHYIRESQKTSGNTEKFEFTKKQETKFELNHPLVLIILFLLQFSNQFHFCIKCKLWNSIPFMYTYSKIEFMILRAIFEEVKLAQMQFRAFTIITFIS